MKKLSCRNVVLCVLLGLSTAMSAEYSWQLPHARVIESGDLEWAPHPFQYQPGEAVRYIDFKNGDDNNDGTTRQSPWKHHPWDARAAGRAAGAGSVDTYVFKQGAIYRGTLVGRESGTPERPIQLTVDPEWGEGEAAFYGSRRITGGWQRVAAQTAPRHMPEPENVWFTDIGIDPSPQGVWLVSPDGEAQRIEIARHPNWTVSNRDDPQSGWLVWERFERGVGLTHEGVFKDRPDGFFDGARIWTDWTGNMGSVVVCRLESVDSERGTANVATGRAAVRAGNRFYVENVAGYLDAPGEYYHATTGEDAGRLYLRLPGDADPNEAIIEVATYTTLIDALDQSHIHINGLRFSFNDTGGPFVDGYPFPAGKPTALRFRGEMRDIAVTHNRFHHVSGAFVAHPRGDRFTTETYFRDMRPWKEDLADGILFTDNDISYSSNRGTVVIGDGPTIYRALEGPRGRLGEARILRNRIFWSGFRQGSNAYSNIATVQLSRPAVGEIAGNIIEMSWGPGIFTFSGNKNQYIGQDSPLTRLFIHHNKVTYAMLATNDWGGIAYWQGGPIYTYNNIAGNVIGYKPTTPLENDWKTVAYNYYLDGTFKSYTFNNIAWGKYNEMTDPYRSRGAYFVVLGYMNHCFNNSFYKFRHGIVGSSGNRSTFLANLISNLTGDFIQQNRPGDTSLMGGGDTGEQGARGMPTNAYGYNVFFGNNRIGNARMIRSHSVEGWREQLSAVNARLAHTGWRESGDAFMDGDNHDFRPRPGTPVAERGVRFFVPFGLYKMVGEWNFIHHPGNETLVLGEHFYMDESFVHRHMYEDVPRNDLTLSNTGADDYVAGPLESWAPGALRFDGETRFGTLPHADITGAFEFKRALDERGRPQSDQTGRWARPRPNLDMDENNFLIEVYFRTDGAQAGTLAGKRDGRGYELGIDAEGRMELTLAGDAVVAASSNATVNDGQWRHVIAEVDRERGVARFYIDGRLDREVDIDPPSSLANGGDFLVGKGGAGMFRGEMAFLRVARGTLADARTTIEELYAWQFDGPFLKHWDGSPRFERGGTAGALKAL